MTKEVLMGLKLLKVYENKLLENKKSISGMESHVSQK